MSVALTVRNASRVKGCFRGDVMRRLAERVCAGEAIRGELELSVLLCDDPEIRALNREYRHHDKPTDVLSFPQDEFPVKNGAQTPRCLGDIAISCETVIRRSGNDLVATREELRLLFCHGLLHLLGYDHTTARDRRTMIEKQAHYLSIPIEAAWLGAPDSKPRRKGAKVLGRGK